MADDPLDRLLDLGLEEKTLGPDTIRSFAEALRERARLVLDERVRGLEERVALLEKENTWRAGAMETLEQRIGASTRESQWKADTIVTLETEIAAIRKEWQKTAEAHDKLLAHHRDTLQWLADALEKTAGTKGWGFRRRVRKQLGQVLAALRKDLA